jgi:predicted restriction endonuclease
MHMTRLSSLEGEREETKAIAEALPSAGLTEKEWEDLRALFNAVSGFPYWVDDRNRPQGESIDASKTAGSKLKRLLNFPDGKYKYGMNLVGRVVDGNWCMRPTFRRALELHGWSSQGHQSGWHEMQVRLGDEVARADRQPRREIEERLAAAEEAAPPTRVLVSTYEFERNPYVVYEALRLAGDSCQGCGGNAPFVRKSDGSPYLEVHHVQPLADGGRDCLSNVVCLCPNCHRQRHFG